MKTRELNQDELSLFFVLTMLENVDGLFEELKLQDGGWVLEAIEKRFKAHKMIIDKKVMIAVLSIGNAVVGICAKYVDDIASWGNNKNTTNIEWNKFTMEVYPNGIPVL